MSVGASKVAEHASGLAAVLAAKKAAQAAGGAPASLSTGAVNSATMQSSTLVPAAVIIVQPELLSPKHVLFCCGARNLNFTPEDCKKQSFTNGYYQTDNEAYIKHLRDNAAAYRITESGPEKKVG